MRDRKLQREVKKYGLPEKRDKCGVKDPTPYQAMVNILLEEARKEGLIKRKPEARY